MNVLQTILKSVRNEGSEEIILEYFFRGLYSNVALNNINISRLTGKKNQFLFSTHVFSTRTTPFALTNRCTILSLSCCVGVVKLMKSLETARRVLQGMSKFSQI